MYSCKFGDLCILPASLIVILPRPRRKTLCYTPTMKKLALKIRSQRSTQYADMTEKLAEPELLACPLGTAIRQIDPANLPGQVYIVVNNDNESIAPPCPTLAEILHRLGATN